MIVFHFSETCAALSDFLLKLFFTHSPITWVKKMYLLLFIGGGVSTVKKSEMSPPPPLKKGPAVTTAFK